MRPRPTDGHPAPVRQWGHILKKTEFAMSKSHRHCSDAAVGRIAAKPREIKRRRQREAMLRPGSPSPCFPDPEPPVWKPLG